SRMILEVVDTRADDLAVAGTCHPLKERLDRILGVPSQRCRLGTIAKRQLRLRIAVPVRGRIVQRERALAIGNHIVVGANACRSFLAARSPVGQQLVTEQHAAVVALEAWTSTDA